MVLQGLHVHLVANFNVGQTRSFAAHGSIPTSPTQPILVFPPTKTGSVSLTLDRFSILWIRMCRPSHLCLCLYLYGKRMSCPRSSSAPPPASRATRRNVGLKTRKLSSSPSWWRTSLLFRLVKVPMNAVLVPFLHFSASGLQRFITLKPNPQRHQLDLSSLHCCVDTRAIKVGVGISLTDFYCVGRILGVPFGTKP